MSTRKVLREGKLVKMKRSKVLSLDRPYWSLECRHAQYKIGLICGGNLGNSFELIHHVAVIEVCQFCLPVWYVRA